MGYIMRQSMKEHIPHKVTEIIQEGEKRFIVTVTYREYQLCDECVFFPPPNHIGWQRFNPLCKANMAMKLLEPQDIGDVESGNCGLMPLYYICAKFEKK